jgi:hypothetical protein
MEIFNRITVEQWQHILSIVSMMLFVCAFIVILACSIGMSRKKLTHMETLPLDGDSSDHE